MFLNIIYRVYGYILLFTAAVLVSVERQRCLAWDVPVQYLRPSSSSLLPLLLSRKLSFATVTQRRSAWWSSLVIRETFTALGTRHNVHITLLRHHGFVMMLFCVSSPTLIQVDGIIMLYWEDNWPNDQLGAPGSWQRLWLADLSRYCVH